MIIHDDESIDICIKHSKAQPGFILFLEDVNGGWGGEAMSGEIPGETWKTMTCVPQAAYI